MGEVLILLLQHVSTLLTVNAAQRVLIFPFNYINQTVTLLDLTFDIRLMLFASYKHESMKLDIGLSILLTFARTNNAMESLLIRINSTSVG